jgi:hypothetical protein
VEVQGVACGAGAERALQGRNVGLLLLRGNGSAMR